MTPCERKKIAFEWSHYRISSLQTQMSEPPPRHGDHFLRGTQRQFSENISSEDDLRSRIVETFVVKFLACLPLLGF